DGQAVEKDAARAVSRTSVAGSARTDDRALIRFSHGGTMATKNGNACAIAALLGCVAALTGESASAAKATECTKINFCYCVNSELRATVDDKVARARQLLADQRKAGKLVGYMSVPLSPAGGGNFDLNREVASNAADAIVQRFGTDQIFVLNPTLKDFDLPNASGADYMLLWTMLLEGPNGLGEDLDFTYFVGPQDFARFFKLNGNADMAKVDAFFDDRVKT